MSSRLSSTALAGLTLLAAFSTPAGASFFDLGPPAASNQVDMGDDASSLKGLRTLPTEAPNLLFSGERLETGIAIFVRAAETAGTARLLLSYDTAISVDPDSSRLLVLVNDQLVSEAPLGFGDRQRLSVDLPPGLLQPGFNAVRLLVDQHHRVDCSLNGSYELWTRLDPQESGLQFSSIDDSLSLSDLAALNPRADGRMSIHVWRSASLASGTQLENEIAAVQALSLLGRFPSPLVSVSDAPGEGTGIDLRIGTFDELQDLPEGLRNGNTHIPFVSLFRDGNGRVNLVVSGPTSVEVARNVEALADAAREYQAGGTSQGLALLAQGQGLAMETGSVHSLADLGYLGRPFTGRHLRQTFALRMPADFYAADYGHATVRLSAAYAGGLSENAQLIVRVNGREVSTLGLSGTRNGIIEEQMLRVPLGAFKPGENRLSFEAVVPSTADLVCDPAPLAERPARFQLSPDTTIELPRLARVGHYPELSATLAGLSGGDERPLTVYVPRAEPAASAAAATLLAKIASTGGAPVDAVVVTQAPSADTGNLIAFGTRDTLPTDLMAVAGVDPGSSIATFQTGTAAALFDADRPAPRASGASFALPAFGSHFSEDAATGSDPASRIWGLIRERLPSAVDAHDAVRPLLAPLAALAAPRSAFASTWKNEARFVPNEDQELVLSQGLAPQTARAAWTVVVAPSKEALGDGVAALTSEARWAEVGGAVTTMAASDQPVETIQAASEHLFATQPFSLGNSRLVLAGWFSRHVEQYVFLLIVVSILSGFTTLAFLRSLGRRRR